MCLDMVHFEFVPRHIEFYDRVADMATKLSSKKLKTCHKNGCSWRCDRVEYRRFCRLEWTVAIQSWAYECGHPADQPYNNEAYHDACNGAIDGPQKDRHSNEEKEQRHLQEEWKRAHEQVDLPSFISIETILANAHAIVRLA